MSWLRPRHAAADDPFVSDMPNIAPKPSAAGAEPGVSFMFGSGLAITERDYADEAVARLKAQPPVVPRFGETSRAAESARLGYFNGRQDGYRSGYISGMHWGMLTGAIAGALLVLLLMWAGKFVPAAVFAFFGLGQ